MYIVNVLMIMSQHSRLYLSVSVAANGFPVVFMTIDRETVANGSHERVLPEAFPALASK